MNYKELWNKFDLGDPLTDKELLALKKQAEDGLAYLDARKEKFVSFKTIFDISRINSYLFFRRIF